MTEKNYQCPRMEKRKEEFCDRKYKRKYETFIRRISLLTLLTET
jgi:hypothetical protein